MCTAISSANERVLLVTQNAAAYCTAICSVSEQVSIVPLAVTFAGAAYCTAIFSVIEQVWGLHSLTTVRVCLITAILSVSERMAGGNRALPWAAIGLICNPTGV
jgi:hypothetical protein